MNIGINLTTMKASVIKGNKIVRQQNIPKDELKSLMGGLCNSDEMLESLRYCAKKLGSKTFLFRDVKGVI